MAVMERMNKVKKPAEVQKQNQRACNDTPNNTTIQVRTRALQWIKDNPDLWSKFKSYALHEADQKRRVSVQWLLEDSRKHDYVNQNGEPCKINNTFAPVLARQLLKECPQIKPYLEVRRSRFDGHDNG